MSTSSISRGRPRDFEARDLILAATFALLGEKGYDGISIEGIAARAKVAKATIYKWWPDRPSLIVEAFFEHTREALAFPETGNVREDFRLQIQALATLLRSPVGAAFAGMIRGARLDAAIGTAIGSRWIGPRKQWGMQRLRRAVDDGTCNCDLNTEAALMALYSVVYAPLLLGIGVPSERDLEDALNLIFDGIFRDRSR